MSYTISARRLCVGLLLLTAGMSIAYFVIGHAAKSILAYVLLLAPGTFYALVVAASMRPVGVTGGHAYWRVMLFVPCLMAGSVLVIMSVLHGWLRPTAAATFGAGILSLLISVIFGLHARRLWMWVVPLAAGALSQYLLLAAGMHFAALPYILILAWWWLVSGALWLITRQPAVEPGLQTQG